MPKGLRGFQKGQIFTVEHRRKLSMARKGKKLTEEHKRNIGLSLIGKTSGMKDKRHSEETKQKMSKAHIGIRHTEETIEKISENNAHRWLGDRVSYRGLHKWVHKYRGQPEFCEFCSRERTTPKSIHWANRSGGYLRNLDDWISLCVPCHKKYDRMKKFKFYYHS